MSVSDGRRQHKPTGKLLESIAASDDEIDARDGMIVPDGDPDERGTNVVCHPGYLGHRSA
jgi:hypothetical protein